MVEIFYKYMNAIGHVAIGIIILVLGKSPMMLIIYAIVHYSVVITVNCKMIGLYGKIM